MQRYRCHFVDVHGRVGLLYINNIFIEHSFINIQQQWLSCMYLLPVHRKKTSTCF